MIVQCNELCANTLHLTESSESEEENEQEEGNEEVRKGGREGEREGGEGIRKSEEVATELGLPCVC